MNRDKAIEIAANTIRDYVIHEGHGEWASAVVARADALLAAMGEPKPRCVHDCCCAATEARVVEEIAVELDAAGMCGRAAWLRSGGWRAKAVR